MIRVTHTEFPVVALTHPGMTGKNNEDRFAVSAYHLNPKDRTPVLLAVLADGIGGHRAGEVAAGIAVEQVMERVGAWEGGSIPQQELRQAIVQASQQIYTLAQSEEGRRGMGSTCTTAWIIGRKLYTATVGDSRLYLMRDGTIRQVSTDHTWVQEAVQHGILKAEEVRGHPNAHVIRRYLGSPQPPEVDFRLRLSDYESDAQAQANQGMPLLGGDRVLLCSDGLTDLVEDAEILAAYENNPLDAATNYLIQLACQRGGHDNITIVVAQIPAEAPRPAPRKRWVLPLVLFLLAVLAAAVVILLTRPGTPGEAIPTAMPSSSPSGGALDPTPQPGEPSLTPTLRPTAMATLPAQTIVAPQQGGATITPWPTNTKPPTP